MYRVFFYYLLALSSSSAFSCEKLDEFVSYKAGIEAERNATVDHAKLIFCNLAYKGDYRAQFKLAHYALNDSEQPDPIIAYVWSKLSVSVKPSKKRQRFVDSVVEQLSDEALTKAEELYSYNQSLIPSGRRIDQEYKPFNLNNYFKRKARKVQTGTRLKRPKGWQSPSSVYRWGRGQ